MSIVVTVGLAIHMPLILVLLVVVVIVVVVVVATRAAIALIIILTTVAILELIQNTTHLQQAHSLLRLAHRHAIQAGSWVEPAVGVPIALGVGLERGKPVGLGIGGHQRQRVARDCELGRLGAVRVGERAEVGAVAARHEVLSDHVGAL